MGDPLIVVAGTGTGIGKTHFAEALLLAWRRVASRVVGLKPIESGVSELVVSDAARLRTASSFHVKQFGYAFAAPLSPHLAAREEGRTVSLPPLTAAVDAARRSAQGVVVELPGGLFTPLSETTLNADWAAALRPDLVILVAPDRLGVLHDVLACSRATCNLRPPMTIGAVVLVHPTAADPSTGRNAAELRRFVEIPIVAALPRGAPEELSTLAVFGQIIDPLR